MATGKRYFWIKLRDNFFDDDGPADFLMSQINGANYVVLYQMLCLKTINTGGRLENRIGEVIIQYDVEKIRRACKYFSADTIRVALELYKSLGLIYEDIDGMLVIANHNTIVGSETDWAAKKQRQRIEGKATKQLQHGDATMDNSGDDGGDNVPIEIRDKRLEIRDKRLDKETNLSISDDIDCRSDERQKVIDEWNSLGISPISRLASGTNRYSMLNARLKEYGLDAVLQAIWNVRLSSFLRGQNKDGWTITFDWFVKPNNFIKVLEGNYTDKEGQARQGEWRKPESTVDRLARLTKEGRFGE